MFKFAAQVLARSTLSRIAKSGCSEPNTMADDEIRADNGRQVKATAHVEPPKEAPSQHAAARRLLTTQLSDVSSRPVEWLFPGRIPLGKLTLISGDPGVGKSFLTLDMAARVSLGAPFPGQNRSSQPPGTAILFSAEDDVEDTIKPRLEAAGADSSRIIAVNGVEWSTADETVTGSRSFSLERDLPELKKLLAEMPDTLLVVIDPISAYCGKTDSHNNAEVRAMLAPLAALAAEYHVAIVCVTHLAKRARGNAVYRSMGSLAFAAAARAVWYVSKDRDDPARRLMLPVKMNLCPDPTGMEYRLVDGRLEWEEEPIQMTADDALAAASERSGSDPTEREHAAEWLRDLLSAGPLPSLEVQEQARECGFSMATIRRAKALAGVKVVKSGFEKGSKWLWKLPPSSMLLTNSEGAHHQCLSTFDDDERLRAGICRESSGA